MSLFTRDFFTFFEGLKQNNTREWFHEHKALYEQAVKEPFAELVEDLINRIRGEEPGFDLQPKDAIFRIYRDTRFSKNKEPYKTHVAAILAPDGRKSGDTPGFYLHFGAEEAMVGGGVYMPEKESIRKIRHAMAAAPDAFAAVLAGREFHSRYGTLLGEQNKIIPAEFRDAHARQPLVANKQFYYMADLQPSVLLDDDLADRLMDYYHAGQPVNAFLQQALSTAV